VVVGLPKNGRVGAVEVPSSKLQRSSNDQVPNESAPSLESFGAADQRSHEGDRVLIEHSFYVKDTMEAQGKSMGAGRMSIDFRWSVDGRSMDGRWAVDGRLVAPQAKVALGVGELDSPRTGLGHSQPLR
jgi:hypothetical protein